MIKSTVRAMFEPLIFSNRWPYLWARHVLFWWVWLLFFTYIYAQKFVVIDPGLAYLSSLLEAIIYLPVHIGLSYALIYVVIPKYLLCSRYLPAVLLTVAGFLIAGVASHLFTVWFVGPLRTSMGLPSPQVSTFFGLMAGLRGANTVAGFAGTIKLLKHWYQKKMENERLQKEKLTAELTLLKAQLHPHFLFNTLNNLYSHIINHSSESGDIVLKLSEMLNYMLYDCRAEKVALAGEVRMLENYVELEKLRYGDRLDVSFRVSGVEPHHSIAPLLLLPFVENAFKHGASQLLEQAWISFSLTVQQDKLSVKIINPVPPQSANQKKEVGIGLENVKKRLEMLYSGMYSLTISENEELYIVSFKLTLHPALSTQPVI